MVIATFPAMSPLEVMLDLETLDVGPRSVVLSIAGQRFNVHQGYQPYEPFYLKLDVDFQTKFLMRTVTLRTIAWWMDQDATLRAEQLGPDNRHEVPEVLEQLQSYCGGASRVWCNGPSFDGTILETLCDDVDMEKPWKYNALRDMRTVRDESELPWDWKPEGEIQGAFISMPHDPLYDCRYQIETVLEARRRFRHGLDITQHGAVTGRS